MNQNSTVDASESIVISLVTALIPRKTPLPTFAIAIQDSFDQ